MDGVSNYFSELPEDPRPAKRPACDPNNLHPLDEEDRKHDDTSEDIDWDEIIATTQDDFEAGRFAFNSADYPTHEAAMVALEREMNVIVERVVREVASEIPHNASGYRPFK